MILLLENIIRGCKSSVMADGKEKILYIDGINLYGH